MTGKAERLVCGFIRKRGMPLAFVVLEENGGSGSGVAGPVAIKRSGGAQGYTNNAR